MPPPGAGDDPEVLTNREGVAGGPAPGALSSEQLEQAVQRAATEVRHRNEDLTPGRILHYVRSERTDTTRCEAAILTQVKADGRVDLTNFPPTGGVLGRVDVPRSDELRPGTYHFTIACPRPREAA